MQAKYQHSKQFD